MSNLRLGQDRFSRKLGLAVIVAMCAVSSVFLGVPGGAPASAQESDRKVITRVEPEYPDALKKLYIGGVVRVEVEVSPNGTVKNVKLLGGNPILGQSTMKAVKSWKYAPAATDETLMVRLEFDPHK